MHEFFAKITKEGLDPEEVGTGRAPYKIQQIFFSIGFALVVCKRCFSGSELFQEASSQHQGALDILLIEN